MEVNRYCVCIRNHSGQDITGSFALIVELLPAGVANDGFHFGVIGKRFGTWKKNGGAGRVRFIVALLCAAKSCGKIMYIAQEKCRRINENRIFCFSDELEAPYD